MPPDQPLPLLNRRDWIRSSARKFSTSAGLLSLGLLTPSDSRGVAAQALPAHRIKGKNDHHQEVEVVGEILSTARDGGILVRTGENRLWTFSPEQILDREQLTTPFQLYDGEQLKQSLQREFPSPFHVTTRGDYLFCTDADAPFLDRCGDLFLRLKKGFTIHWENHKLPLSAPEQELVVILFRNRDDYRKYATREFDARTSLASGYFSVMQNRIVLYDVTAGESWTQSEVQAKVAEQISTIIHEATHQLAFNTGLEVRLADNPLWFTEGLAMYFETPDFSNKTGWRTAGLLNRPRVRDLLRDFSENAEPSLEQFIAQDTLFHSEKREVGAYGRAWGLFYYLMNQRRPQMVNYIKVISTKPRLVWDSPETRIREFESSFGKSSDVEQALLHFLNRIERRRLPS